MKPMLACSTMPDLKTISYPKLASTKFDGIRCLVIGGVAMSRNMKPIPNKYVQSLLGKEEFNGFDGELILRWTKNFSDVYSAFMSVEGTPDFIYCVFDDFSEIGTFLTRSASVTARIGWRKEKYLSTVPQIEVRHEQAVIEFYDCALAQGFEGLILRDPRSPYKRGRSTAKQEWMLKVKPVEDMEGTVVGFEELMHNSDTSTKHQDNMVPGNMLGALVLEFKLPKPFIEGTRQVKVGSGFTQVMRRAFWIKRQSLLGKQVTFKYQELSPYGIPRFPVFKSFRSDHL